MSTAWRIPSSRSLRVPRLKASASHSSTPNPAASSTEQGTQSHSAHHTSGKVSEISAEE